MDLGKFDSSVFSQWLNGDISMRSMILHAVGCIFIGTPDALNMPNDFYYIEGDRNIPHPNEYKWERQRELLYVDTFRRILTEKLGKWCLAIALAIFLSGLILQGLATGVKTLYNQGEQTFNRILSKEPAIQQVSEMTLSMASKRLQEIKFEYAQINTSPVGEREQKKILALKREATEILSKFPNLNYIVQEQ
jgi:hypothetical protein